MTLNIRTLKHLVLLSFIFFFIQANAQNRILVDGEFKDWNSKPVAETDAAGDGGSSGIDFEKVQISNDRDHLFFYIEVGNTINLQEDNDIALYIDIDNNAATGPFVNGIGSELVYYFGNRSGTYGFANIGHADIGIITAPTVGSDKFEIAIKRSFVINGNSVTMGGTIKALFKDNSTNGDHVPNAEGGLTYTFSETQLVALPAYSFNKPTTSDLRVLSYNVERDGFFTANRIPAYTRILQAVQPDIIGFQEIYDNTSQQIADQVETILPSNDGEQWYYAGEDPDCHAISRYPILRSEPIDGNAAFLIDIPNTDEDMLLIVAHPPCCGNNAGRQQEVDQIMQFVRDAKAGNGPITLEEGAPILIVGDMNFVGGANQLQTLLTGDISNNATYGADFTPDWDGSNLIDSKPYATNTPFNFSWYSESSAFSPGRLDFVIYSGSNLELDNSYSLFTPGITTDSLNARGLQSSDVLIASDHLPLVADFTLKNKATTSVTKTNAELIDLKVNPNPAFDKANISFSNLSNGRVIIHLWDLNGKEIDVIHNGNLSYGKQAIPLDASKYTAGSYVIKVSTNEGVVYKRFMVR